MSSMSCRRPSPDHSAHLLSHDQVAGGCRLAHGHAAQVCQAIQLWLYMLQPDCTDAAAQGALRPAEHDAAFKLGPASVQVLPVRAPAEVPASPLLGGSCEGTVDCNGCSTTQAPSSCFSAFLKSSLSMMTNIDVIHGGIACSSIIAPYCTVTGGSVEPALAAHKLPDALTDEG